MSENPVRTELRSGGAVLHLTLNAPKANVLDSAMIAGLLAAIDAHAGRADLKAIVFRGEGGQFCYGASVAEHVKERAPGMLSEFHGLFRRLAELAVPTAALVEGRCLGGGMELATWCTWIVAAPGARFGQPEIKLAVLPPMASLILPWRAGGASALDLCVSGRTLDAEAALDAGLITAVDADPAGWWDRFYAEHMAGLSASSLRFAERAARMGLVEAMETRLPKLERLYLDELMETHDANEGIAAFLERRPPQLKHR